MQVQRRTRGKEEEGKDGKVEGGNEGVGMLCSVSQIPAH